MTMPAPAQTSAILWTGLAVTVVSFTRGELEFLQSICRKFVLAPRLRRPLRRAGGARADHELVWQGDRLGRLRIPAAGENPQEQPHRAFADLAHRLRDRRQRRRRVARETDV